ncbi:MAG: hypothetical protein K2F87_05400 [Muribaculaceae bacterium]|nr:hypothetical protein [Muribaculaceae bacterium]
MTLSSYQEAIELLRRYPSFTFALRRAIELFPPDGDADVRKRLMTTEAIQLGRYIPQPDATPPSPGEREIQARNLIINRNYKEALAIIQDLNLNNPEKSIYFADQIRFLKKLIINQTKINN